MPANNDQRPIREEDQAAHDARVGSIQRFGSPADYLPDLKGYGRNDGSH
jgi:hypothetical protein